MLDEEAFAKLFREKFCTTPDQKDPRKPIILQGEMLQANPDYNAVLVDREQREAEIERRKTQCGTSFFLNFDPVCHLHQISSVNGGDRIRQGIKEQLRKKIFLIFARQFSGDSPPPFADFNNCLQECLQTAICPKAQVGFNNGEVYLWLRKLKLTEDFAFTILRELIKSIEQFPVSIYHEGKVYEVQFYGWGFRYF